MTRLSISLLLIALSSPALADTRLWPTGPPPCDDIADLQSCVNAALSGDVIEIAADAIPGQTVSIPESGQPLKSLTLRPAAGFAPVFGDFTSIFAAGGDENITIVIDGLTLQRGRIDASQGGDGTFDVTYRNNRVLGVSSSGTALRIRSGNAQPPYGPTLFAIENNEVEINQGPNNTVSAISVGGFQDGVNVGRISGNVVRQIGGDQNAAINIFNSNAILEVDAIGNQISGANFNEGIALQQGGTGAITGRIINNTISGQVDDAGLPGAITLNVGSTATGDFTVINNTVAFNENGLQTRVDPGAVVTGILANNIFAFNQEDGLDLRPEFQAGVADESNLVFGNGSNFFDPGPGTIFADPRFVSPDNLRTRIGSAARDSGSDAHVPIDITTDVVGNSRIRDGAVDIGAFEDGDDVLLLNQQCGGSGAYLPAALISLGIDFVEAQDHADFELQLTNGSSWDLILVDEYDQSIPGTALAALRDHVDAGGRAYMSYWNVGASPLTVESFGAAASSPRSIPPVVDFWLAAHPLGNDPSVIGTLTPDANTCNTDAWGFDPLASAIAVGGFTASPTAGEAGIIVGNEGRTVLLGTTPGLYPSSEMIPFLENVIGFLLAPDILLLDAPCTGSTSHFPAVLEDLDLGFVHTATAERFDGWLSSGRDWRLIVVDADSDMPQDGAALDAYLSAGGRAWWNGSGTEPATAAALESTLGAAYTAPRAIRRWAGACCDPGHPLYRDPAVPELLSPDADTCSVDGFELSPVGGGVALAGFTSVPAVGQGALISGNAGRTLHFGGMPGLFPGAEMVPLLRGALRFLLSGYPLYSIERFGSTLHTVELNDGSTRDAVGVQMDGSPIEGSMALAMSPVSGELWQIVETEFGRELARVDPFSGLATAVGSPDRSINGMAFDCRGTLFAVSGENDLVFPESLFELSTQDGSATFLTALSNGDDGEALAHDPDARLLYHGSGDAVKVFESIDPFSLDRTPIPLSGTAFSTLRALTYLSPGQMLVSDGSELLAIDTLTGVVGPITALDHTTKGLASTDLRCCLDPGDADCDGIPNGADLCPFHAELDPAADADGNGIGDECECGDQTGDGLVNVADILAINEVIFELQSPHPLCDTNEDGQCNVADILGANAKIFGADAFCSRYPAP